MARVVKTFRDNAADLIEAELKGMH